jgi:CspA family cold shock protein
MSSKGVVKFFNESKGYGFIKDDSTNDDVFVHATALNGKKIRENDRVSFKLTEGKRGINATDVEIIRN